MFCKRKFSGLELGIGNKRRLLGAVVFIGVGLANLPATAAEIGTGGQLDLTVSGFVGMNAYGGALDNQGQDPDLSTELDFGNDTELYFVLGAEDEATGLEYGGTVALDADTNITDNAYATWVYLSGGWGELRLGDEEGPVDESALGAGTIAAGTGGIDGDVVDELAVDAVSPTTSEEATKIRYYTPNYTGLQVGASSNLQLGVSYTPDGGGFGDTLAGTETEVGHWVEAAIAYIGEWETFSLAASVLGSVGEEENDGGSGQLWTGYAGATVAIDDLELGAGFGSEDVGGLEKTYLNVGIGYAFESVGTSLTFGRVLETRGYEGVGEPWNLALSADVNLAEGLILAGDMAYFDNDLQRDAREPTGGDNGLVWVTRLEVSF